MVSDSHRRLGELMQSEIDAVGRLRAVLEREFSALKGRDVDGIERVVAEKQTLIGELERYGSERENLLKREGCTPDKLGFQAFLGRAGGAVARILSERWEHLREELKACQAQNLVNGQVLEANRRTTQQTLALLLGKPPAQQVRTYDRSGSTSLNLGTRTFAKA